MFGLVLGFGAVAAGTTFVQASERSGFFGFFDDLFRPAPPQAVVRAPHRAPRRYASLPDARRIAVPRTRQYTPRPLVDLTEPSRRRARAPMRAERVPLAVAGGPQTVCVRTCDGYLFPLGRLRSQRDVPVHQAACSAACPSARTALFTLPSGRSELDQAVSLKGRPYLAAAWANVYRRKRVENCSCQPPGVAAAPLPIERDGTIRVGDIVASEDSADIVTDLSRGTVQLADYRSARGVSRRGRRQIERQVGTMRRDADEAKFLRSLKTATRHEARVRLAEAGFAHLRKIEAETGSVEVPSDGRQPYTPIRVVAPWTEAQTAR